MDWRKLLLHYIVIYYIIISYWPFPNSWEEGEGEEEELYRVTEYTELVLWGRV